MRVLILQFGDYAEAYRRLLAGGPETFRDQLHTVLFVASLASYNQVTIVAGCDRCHDEELAPGLRAIGIPRDMVWDSRRLWPLLDRLAPEVFICGGPNRIPLAWAAKKRVTILPIFADVFTDKGLRNRLKNWRLGRSSVAARSHAWRTTASRRHIHFVASVFRSTRSCPGNTSGWSRWAKPRAPPTGSAVPLVFAGWLSESKGVGDCIEAVAIARSALAQVDLTLAGPGNADPWIALARRHGVEASVQLLGVIPAERVLSEMRESDAVIVASRHDYAEGLPNTIFEALASRSPLIASDHPAFARRLQPEIDSLRFKAADPRGLAAQIERLIREPGLYARLSQERRKGQYCRESVSNY